MVFLPFLLPLVYYKAGGKVSEITDLGHCNIHFKQMGVSQPMNIKARAATR